MKLLFFSLKKNSPLFLLGIFLWLINFEYCFADMKAPPATQTIIENSQVQSLSLNQVVFGSMVLFYAKVISPLDGPRSPSYPTGSAYGIKALQTEGIFMGILLIGDRLFHEAEHHQGAPYIKIYGRTRYYDPIENNTFWWKN